MLLLIAGVVVLVGLFLFVILLARLGRKNPKTIVQTPKPSETKDFYRMNEASPPHAFSAHNQTRSRVCAKCHGTHRQNCVWCGGSGGRMTTRTVMETKMVPTTEYRTDYRGHRSPHIVMKPTPVSRTVTERTTCSSCGGSGKTHCSC